jgi:hypothetical protein
VKKPKVQVDYSKGMRTAHCGICIHFQKNRERCELVLGKIDPAYWCKLFSKRP